MTAIVRSIYRFFFVGAPVTAQLAGPGGYPSPRDLGNIRDEGGS